MMHLSTPLLSYVSIILIVPLSFAEVYQETDEDSSDYSERKNGDCGVERTEVDLAFMIDCTGSMVPHINATTDSVHSIVNETKSKENSVVNIALVLYRDFLCETNRFTLPFTKDADEVTQFMKVYCKNRLECSHQKGVAEDVIGALDATINLTWSSTNRVIFHIADAPAHGSRFVDINYLDNLFPDGNPKGEPKIEDLLRKIKEKDLKYFFGEVDQGKTAKMINEFNRVGRELGVDEIVTPVDLRDEETVKSRVLDAVSKVIKETYEKKNFKACTEHSRMECRNSTPPVTIDGKETKCQPLPRSDHLMKGICVPREAECKKSTDCPTISVKDQGKDTVKMVEQCRKKIGKKRGDCLYTLA